MTPQDAMQRRRIGWRAAALAGLIVAALVAAAAWYLHEPPVTARPALWRISRDGTHGWLFGTIHAVPRGARWLSPAIEKAVAESDVLILEATGLASERDERTAFETLGRSPGLPTIAARLSDPDRARFIAFSQANKALPPDLDLYESWAAALLIGAAANRDLSQEDAGEARLEARFRDAGRPVQGLETIAAQLGAFDTLAEPDQRALLAQAVTEAPEASQQFQLLYTRWSSGDVPALEQQFLAPPDRLPAVRKALIDQRNAMWAQQIDRLLRQDGKVRFVAVGTGHLLGAYSVQSRLAALGWQIERVQ